MATPRAISKVAENSAKASSVRLWGATPLTGELGAGAGAVARVDAGGASGCGIGAAIGATVWAGSELFMARIVRKVMPGLQQERGQAGESRVADHRAVPAGVIRIRLCRKCWMRPVGPPRCQRGPHARPHSSVRWARAAAARNW